MMMEKKIFKLAGSVASFNEVYETLKNLGVSFREFISARNSRVLRRRCKAHGIVAVSREEALS